MLLLSYEARVKKWCSFVVLGAVLFFMWAIPSVRALHHRVTGIEVVGIINIRGSDSAHGFIRVGYTDSIGQHRSQTISAYRIFMTEGQSVRLFYDSNNPTRVTTGRVSHLQDFIGVTGFFMLFSGIRYYFKNKRNEQDEQALQLYYSNMRSEQDKHKS